MSKSIRRQTQLLNKKEVAEILNVSTRTIPRWVALGKCPPPIRFTRKTIRWRPEEIERLMNQSRAASA